MKVRGLASGDSLRRQDLGALALLVVAVLTRSGAGQPCPIVDRGSPTDGVTTITVLEEEAECVDGPLWDGWRCIVLRSDANDNGVQYSLDIRWNRADLAVRGSFTWLKGHDSTDFIREISEQGRLVQDLLDTEDEVRTIELKFLGTGTHTPPRNGFVNISAVYADILEFLVTNGIAEGVIGHYGNSAGSMMAANALAYHDLDEVLDGAVFGGGPFWSDLRAFCTNPDSRIFGTDDARKAVDRWNWKELTGSTACFDMAEEAEPPYTCRSTLGVEADSVYPDVIVAVIVGTEDPLNPLLLNSALHYWHGITAERKSFDQPFTLHLVVGWPEGAQAVYERIREIVDAGQMLGDLDGDGVVGINDLLQLLGAWGPCPDPCPPFCLGDLDADCDVGITDFLLLLANWG